MTSIATTESLGILLGYSAHDERRPRSDVEKIFDIEEQVFWLVGWDAAEAAAKPGDKLGGTYQEIETELAAGGR